MRTFGRTVYLLIVALAALAGACSGGDGEKGAGSTRPDAATPAAGAFPAGTAAGAVATRPGVPIAGGRLVLAREQGLLIRNARGDEQRLLRTPSSTFPTFPMWSPDGERIAYVQATVFTGQPNADWGGDIYVVAAGGGEPKLVWKHDQPGAQVQGLTWTPDGAALLLGYQLTLIKDNKYQGQVQRIERLDLTGGSRKTVVEGAFFPTLSRDGARLAYMTQDDTGKGGLWIAAADGSGAKQLLELGPKYLAILYPRIAPDGSAIAFAGVVGQAAEPGRAPGAGGGLRAALRALLPRPAAAHGLPMDVWTVKTADGAVTRLTNLNEDEPYPAWLPDGAQLTVLATGGLYEIHLDGGVHVQKIGPGSFGGQVDAK